MYVENAKKGWDVKNTIKKIGYGMAVALVLSIPVIALAQFNYAEVSSVTQLPATEIYVLIQNLLRWLLYIIGFLAVLAFIIAGMLYLLSAGNETQMEKAKKAMIAAIIGVIVSLLGLIIITAVYKFLLGNQGTKF